MIFRPSTNLSRLPAFLIINKLYLIYWQKNTRAYHRDAGRHRLYERRDPYILRMIESRCASSYSKINFSFLCPSMTRFLLNNKHLKPQVRLESLYHSRLVVAKKVQTSREWKGKVRKEISCVLEYLVILCPSREVLPYCRKAQCCNDIQSWRSQASIGLTYSCNMMIVNYVLLHRGNRTVQALDHP